MNDQQTLPRSFGECLKSLRRRQRLTQRQLAERMGVHANTISAWELGTYLPTKRSLVLELARQLRLDEQESRHLLEASLTAPAAYWMVPHPRNPFFTGREPILAALHAGLGFEQADAPAQALALYGLAGVGKTQIALEYAYRHGLEYSAVFWIGTETEEQIISSLLRVASVLQVPRSEKQDQQRVLAEVQRWLSTHSQWLLIWDNVEDLDLLHRFLPSSRSGALLITTRSHALGSLARSLDLAPMDQEEGTLFLLRRAQMVDAQAGGKQFLRLAERLPEQATAASELVSILGGLPLALDQAGAYVEETHCGLAAYLELFRTRRATLLTLRGEGAREHPASVSTTLTLALRAVAERHPAVLDLLQVCALLQPDAIPEELFRKAGEHLGPPLQAVCGNPLEWDRVVSIAGSYSLLTRQSEERMLSLHRLVQAVLLDRMTEAEQKQWNRRVIGALDALLPKMWSETEAVRGERLLLHALLSVQRAASAEESLALASLSEKTGQYLLYKQSDHAQAETLFQHARSLRECLLGADHPLVAASLQALASAAQAQGKYAQAEGLYHRALLAWEKTAEPDDGEMASILRGLGFVSWQQAKDEQAEAFYHRALRTLEQIGGLHHPEGAFVFHDLGLLSHHQGQFSQAEALYQRARQIWEQALGSEHPWVGHALKNLADLSREQGQSSQAEALYHQARQIWEQALGSDHLWVAYALHGQALFSQQQGRYREAEALFQRALAIRERQLGEQHPETAWTLHDLAVLRRIQGKLDEAICLAERALTIRASFLGEAHPRTIDTQTLSTQLGQEQADGGELTLESLRALLKACGWSLHLKKRHDKPYVYATRKVGQHTQSRYLAPLSNLAACLAAARTLPNAKEQ